MTTSGAIVLAPIFWLLSAALCADCFVRHGQIVSRQETVEEMLLHDPHCTKYFDPKMANAFELIRPENIIESSSHIVGNFPYADSAATSESIYSIATPTNLFIDNNDIVNISFYTGTPNHTDWIAAYSPAINNIADLNKTVPVLFGWADTAFGSSYYNNSSNDGKNYGRGFLTFNFTNLRANISFVYYTNGLTYPVIMNTSAFTVTFNNFNEPLKPRVIPTGNPDVYNVTWSSANSTIPTLKWGNSSGTYTHTALAITSTISRDDMCDDVGGIISYAKGIGWRDLGQVHSAALRGMLSLSSKKVYYIFGDDATSDYSEEFVLNVAPKAGTQPPNRGTRAILANDWGRGSTDMTYTWNEFGRPAVRTAECVGAEVANGTVDVVYVGGDLSYADGYEAVWDFFENMMVPITSSAIFLTTSGNHESDWPSTEFLYNTSYSSGGECGIVSNILYNQPAPSNSNQYKNWWSYDVGIIHFVGMNTEYNFSIGSEQWNWLKKDLENVNRTTTPWIIFGGHRAMYVNSDFCCHLSENVQQCGGENKCDDNSDIAVMNQLVGNIEQLLFDNKVNFAFWGHNHVVQRQSAVFNYTVIEKSVLREIDGEPTNCYDDPQATVHFVIGSGGANFTINAFPRTSPDFPVWNEEYFYEYGYARVEALNSSYLLYEWVNNTPPYEVLDRVIIYQKNPHAPFDPIFPSSDDNDDSKSSGGKASLFSKLDLILVCVLVPVALVVVACISLAFYRKYRSNYEGSSSSSSSKENLKGDEIENPAIRTSQLELNLNTPLKP